MVAATDKYSGLSAAQARELLAYDPETGILTWKVSIRGRIRAGIEAGNTNNGYRGTIIAHRRYLNHRLAWLIYYGEWPKDQLDHIDGDGENNRIGNLRSASATINNQNKNKIRPQKNNRLGITGVTVYRGKYRANLKVSGRSLNLGSYNTIEEARDAYLKAKRELHEGNTL